MEVRGLIKKVQERREGAGNDGNGSGRCGDVMEASEMDLTEMFITVVTFAAFTVFFISQSDFARLG